MDAQYGLGFKVSKDMEENLEKLDLPDPSTLSPLKSDTLFEDEELEGKPLVLTQLGQVLLWEKMKKFPILFAGAKETNFSTFVGVLEDTNTILLGFHRKGEKEPLGLGMITDIIPGVEARVQISFFDQTLKGREQFIRLFTKWIFDTFLVRRIAAGIRADARAMRAFLERVGFYLEGVYKAWIKKGTKLHDLYQYAVCDYECDEHWMLGRSWAKPRVRLLEIYEVR